MFAMSYHKGTTIKEVSIADIHGETDEEILAYAMTVAGETKSSLFGTSVGSRGITGTVAIVTLHTN